ncbi:putative leucine aminopeptidase 1 [Diplonema papillatum]|nr:putative leucine aminopeptidase 1 [Diplonema papillatum]|eukprot:gene6933-10659_t
MKTAMCLLALAAGAAGSSWCATMPMPPAKAEHLLLGSRGGGEFRGTFRDFSLFRTAAPPAGCVPMATDAAAGLWVVEFRSAEEKRRELAKATRNGLTILFDTNTSAVIGGGEDVPDTLGYDACGAEKAATIVSVSPHAVKVQSPMDEKTAEYRKKSSLKTNPAVEEVLRMITARDMADVISHLESYNSRNSYTGSDLVEATQWLADQYTAAGFNVTRPSFRDDMSPQVVAEFKGQGPDAGVVVIGAHSDSRSTRSSDATQRAPGADDNGSGTAALVLIARAIKASGIRLRHTIQLMSFTGEEQGLLGSRALAAQYRAEGVNVVAMVNGDMLGYRLPGKPIELAFMDRNANLEWTAWSREIIGQYIPGLPTGFSGACCSDQQSFHENGFPSIGLFEHPGSFVEYPQYHTSDDLLRYLDQEQLMLESKGMAASAVIFAQPLD